MDIGASATKAVLLDGAVVRARALHKSGADFTAAAQACLDEVVAEAGLDPTGIKRVVATGYGRRSIAFATSTVTEITCHARGCFAGFPHAMTIVDIGGQDNKVIAVKEDGARRNFKMNRKCAAGTGAFLEEIALRLDVELEELERLASSTTEAVRLNSFCTVFASTEILSHLRRGEPLADLIRGAFASVVNRVAEMDRLDGEVVLTGGVVAHNPTTAEIFADKVDGEVKVPPDPQFTGALGAALTALAQEEKNA